MRRRTDESLLQQFRIDDFEISGRKVLFGFAPSDAETLFAARAHVLGALDAVVDEFYRRQTEIEDVALIIGDSETMRRLRIAQRRYVDDLFSGIYDEDYVNNRLRIGLVHKRIGLEPKYYLSALGMLRQILHAAVAASLQDAPHAARVTAALDKLLDFDTAFVFDAYFRSVLSEVEAVKEGALRYARTLEDKVAQRTRELEMLSRHDALTGLLNRRAFADSLRQELARARRTSTPIAVLYIDIDDFKAVNDTRGHQKGDEVLVMVAELLRQTSRENDILARLGGDEFCAVLPGMDAPGASAFSRRFRDALQGRDRSVTASIGVCCTGPVEFSEPDALLHTADMRMYDDKAGRHAAPGGDTAVLAAG
jgi:diguanylate cyclase (GGDEF)-like protein